MKIIVPVIKTEKKKVLSPPEILSQKIKKELKTGTPLWKIKSNALNNDIPDKIWIGATERTLVKFYKEIQKKREKDINKKDIGVSLKFKMNDEEDPIEVLSEKIKHNLSHHVAMSTIKAEAIQDGVYATLWNETIENLVIIFSKEIFPLEENIKTKKRTAYTSVQKSKKQKNNKKEDHKSIKNKLKNTQDIFTLKTLALQNGISQTQWTNLLEEFIQNQKNSETKQLVTHTPSRTQQKIKKQTKRDIILTTILISFIVIFSAKYTNIPNQIKETITQITSKAPIANPELVAHKNETPAPEKKKN